MPLYETKLRFTDLYKSDWPVAGYWLIQFPVDNKEKALLRLVDAAELAQWPLRDPRWLLEVSPTGEEPTLLRFEVLALFPAASDHDNSNELCWPSEAMRNARNLNAPFTMADMRRECVLRLPAVTTKNALGSALADRLPREEDSPALHQLFEKWGEMLLLHEHCNDCLTPYGSAARKFYVPALLRFTCWECLVKCNQDAVKTTATRCIVAGCKKPDCHVWIWQTKAKRADVLAGVPLPLCESHSRKTREYLKDKLKAVADDTPPQVAMKMQRFVVELFAVWTGQSARSASSDEIATALIVDHCAWLLTAATWTFFGFVNKGSANKTTPADFSNSTPPWLPSTLMNDTRDNLFPNPEEEEEEEEAPEWTPLNTFNDLDLVEKIVSRIRRQVPLQNPYADDRALNLATEVRTMLSENDKLKNEIAQVRTEHAATTARVKQLAQEAEALSQATDETAELRRENTALHQSIVTLKKGQEEQKQRFSEKFNKLLEVTRNDRAQFTAYLVWQQGNKEPKKRGHPEEEEEAATSKRPKTASANGTLPVQTFAVTSASLESEDK